MVKCQLGNKNTNKGRVNTQSSVINDHTGVSVDVKTDISYKETTALMLYDNDMIHRCNQAGGELFDYSTSGLTGMKVGMTDFGQNHLEGANSVLQQTLDGGSSGMVV